MQIQTQHLDLHAAISTFCVANGMAKSAFGVAAVGDPNLIRDLERGRELRSRTVRKVQDYIRSSRAIQAPQIQGATQ